MMHSYVGAEVPYDLSMRSCMYVVVCMYFSSHLGVLPGCITNWGNVLVPSWVGDHEISCLRKMPIPALCGRRFTTSELLLVLMLHKSIEPAIHSFAQQLSAIIRTRTPFGANSKFEWVLSSMCYCCHGNVLAAALQKWLSWFCWVSIGNSFLCLLASCLVQNFCLNNLGTRILQLSSFPLYSYQLMYFAWSYLY